MRIREVLEWTEINGKPYPKRTKITFIDEPVPKFDKNSDIAVKSPINEQLIALSMEENQ